VDFLEQRGMVAGFDTQDETATVFLQILDVRPIRTGCSWSE
jgi:hypothetical protein